MLLGSEWLIDASGCDPQALADLGVMRALCERVLVELELHVVGEPQWHQFPPPGGVTGLYLLSESHLACHTFPEHGAVTFNLYCCRPRRAWNWSQQLQSALGAERVTVRRSVRGDAAGNSPDVSLRYEVLQEDAP
jgi:S-adenosylmethionine decarboxylase